MSPFASPFDERSGGCAYTGGGVPCNGSTPPGTTVPLCERHLALASEESAAALGWGVEDALPSPCLLCASRLGIRYPSGWLCAVCEWRAGEIPDHELAPPRVDVVYYIRYGDRIKIGTSANPAQRLAALWHDSVLAFERGDRAQERRRHEQFADDRLGRSEWFVPSEALLAHIDVLAGGVDPWDRHRRWVSEAIASQ